MNMTESSFPLGNAQQAFVSAVAHQIERMSKEEVQALVAKGLLELQTENAVLKERAAHLEAISTEQAKTIETLEADKVRLYYQISRSLFNEKDYENFDPSEYTVSAEEMLAEMDKLLEGSKDSPTGR